MSDLPPWPDAPSILGSLGEFRYERARADAAIARLRVALKALGKISLGGLSTDPLTDDQMMDLALAARQVIGPLPEDV